LITLSQIIKIVFHLGTWPFSLSNAIS